MSADTVMHGLAPVCALLPEIIKHANDGHKAPPLNTPQSLKLRFTDAADLPRVIALFSPMQKKRIDPDNYVRPRDENQLATPIAQGDAIIALDENDNIRCFAMAMHHENQTTPQNGVTEIGAVMSDVGGIGLSKTAIAALSAQQKIKIGNASNIIAQVRRCNAPSISVFERSLGWDAIIQPADKASITATLQQNNIRTRPDTLHFAFAQKALKRTQDLLDTFMNARLFRSKCGTVEIKAQLPRELKLATL